MANSKIARGALSGATTRAFNKNEASYKKKTAANNSRFKDSGTAGAAEKKKRQAKINEKTLTTTKAIAKKSNTDSENISRYGKDAMKSRGFATMPNTKAKAKKKPMTKKK